MACARGGGELVLLWLASSALCCATASPARSPAAADDPARAVVDFAAADAWLGCARASGHLATCEAASAATEGGRLAALCADTFGAGEPPADSIQARAVEALVAQMKAWPDVLPQAARFLPARVGGGALRAFVVANGNRWGDAYVRPFAGEPVVFLNAALIAARYPGDAPEQARQARGVLAHELFHALFRRYRASDSSWSRFDPDRSPSHALQLLVLNEGIGHFVHRQERLTREGFPPERAAAALAALGSAWERLQHLAPQSPEVEALLTSAARGAYWDKYGSIAGMLLAHGVYRAAGEEGIREAVRCGPGRLLSLYARAAERSPDLPALPRPLGRDAWIDLCAAPAGP